MKSKRAVKKGGPQELVGRAGKTRNGGRHPTPLGIADTRPLYIAAFDGCSRRITDFAKTFVVDSRRPLLLRCQSERISLPSTRGYDRRTGTPRSAYWGVYR